ncbi:hypothetical protein V1477_008875 [Vespula maculifrons]|uniref:Uncharacterized protein n=1 Tax=Vespula maculifrons TaxID=7453 RepID=A0ABD2CEA1_VESMC
MQAVACATGTIATIAAVADDDEDDDDDDGDECSSVRSCPTIFFARDAFGVQFVRHRGQSTTNEYISTISLSLLDKLLSFASSKTFRRCQPLSESYQMHEYPSESFTETKEQDKENYEHRKYARTRTNASIKRI